MDYQKEYLEKNPGLHLEHASIKKNQIISVLVGFPRSQRILEVGCGAGALMIALAKEFKPRFIEGIDVSWQMINKARELDTEKLVNWRVADIFDYNISEPFDLIVCSDIIEHLKNDAGFLKIIKNFGREIVIRVPLEKSHFSKFLVNANIFNVWKDTEYRYGHIHHYNEEELLKLFGDCGLKIISSRAFPMPKRSRLIWEVFRLLFYPLGIFSVDFMVRLAGGFKVFRLKY